MGARIVWPLAIVLMLLLAACLDSASQEISVEEARRMAADIQASEFAPPPRTIYDLKMIIGELPAAPTEEKCVDIQDFRERQIATITGRIREATSKTNRDNDAADLVVASESEFTRGNFLTTIELIERAINLLPESGVRQSIFHVQLARVHAAIGDRRAASHHATRAHSLWNKIRTQDRSGYYSSADGTFKRTLYTAIGEAAVFQAEGRLVVAEGHYRTAIEKARHAFGPYTHVDIIGLQADLAANLLQQGRLAEAELIAREGVVHGFRQIKVFSKFYSNTAQATAQLAEVLSEQNRLEDAEYVARVAISLHRIDCSRADSLGYLRARQILAQILAAKSNWAGVLEQIEAVRGGLVDQPALFEHFFGHNASWALALIHSGRAEEGLRPLKKALERAIDREGADSFAAAEARGFLGIAYSVTGNIERALGEFSVALPSLLRRREQEDWAFGQQARSAAENQILNGYLALLLEIRDRSLESQMGIDTVTELLRVASLVRSSTVQFALSASATRAAARDPELAELVRQQQDAGQALAAAIGTLLFVESAPLDQVDPSLRVQLRERVPALRAAQATLLGEIAARFPEYADLMNPAPPTVAELQSHLTTDEALLLFHALQHRTLVWAIPARGELAFHAAPLGREALRAKVTALRRALDPKPETLGDIPAFDIGGAHDLYRALLAPLEETWQPARQLIAIKPGALGQLPLSILVTEPGDPAQDESPLFSGYRDVAWLARSHGVTSLPSISALKTLRSLPPGSETRRAFVGFGDPWFSAEQALAASQEGTLETAVLSNRGILATRGLPVQLRALPQMEGVDSADLAMLPRLPDTADEVNSIALALNADLTRDVFIGKAANEAAIKTLDLSGYKVLAFATHGLVPGDLNGLTQPALALTAPQVAGVEGDGLLTMSEILALKLDADWVVLSACNTAAADGAGAEAISGLGRAFFYAGARSLLVSNWPVETTSARMLTTDIFHRQATDPTLSRAEALRQAMVALIDGRGYVDDEGNTVFSYAHPIFWAPFTLVGDGGNSQQPGI